MDRELFDRVQAIMAGRYIPSKRDGTVKSPLAGLVKCANCGMNMQRMVMKRHPYLLCTRPGCCASTKFELVEKRVLDSLQDSLDQLSVRKPASGVQDTSTLELSLLAVQKELAGANRQKNRLYELLELGEYDIPTFRERMEAVKGKIAALERKEAETRRTIDHAKTADPQALAQRIRAVLDAYGSSDNAQRNALLKSVIDQVWYSKAKKTKPNDFDIQLDLKPF